jgi:hypothetical protein
MEPAKNDQQLIDAFYLVRGHFPQFSGEQVLAALLICQKNGGLYTLPQVKPRILFAFFRYHPLALADARRMLAVVQEFDIDTLRVKDLTRGPCLHAVALVAPTDGLTVFRSMIDVFNPFTISAHRWNHGNFRFRMKQNRHYKPRPRDQDANTA